MEVDSGMMVRVEAGENWGGGMREGWSVGTKLQLDGRSGVLLHSRVTLGKNNVLYIPKSGRILKVFFIK
jgi:hypothetical protein